MKKIKAVPITEESFLPFGRYFNLFNIPARECEDFIAHTSLEELTDEPMNLGLTICRGTGSFTSVSMERHMLTEEPQFCGNGPMILTVADSDPMEYPKADDVQAFIMKPGDVVIIAKGIWHDANHGIEQGKDIMYYFMATNKEPDNLREIEWVIIQPEPVDVEVRIEDK